MAKTLEFSGRRTGRRASLSHGFSVDAVTHLRIRMSYVFDIRATSTRDSRETCARLLACLPEKAVGFAYG